MFDLKSSRASPPLRHLYESGAGIVERLNFTSTNEDGEIELAALRDSRRILCLTGTGTRVLDLLGSDAEEVVALDANPAQNFLLELKMAAIARLDRNDCLRFLGIAPDTARLDVYAELRDHLPPEARRYWDGSPKVVADGIWHAGRWEALLRWNARFLRLLRGRAVRSLMNAPTIADQALIWERNFVPTGLWRAMETLGRDLVWRFVMREASAVFLPDAKTVGARIEEDFRRASGSFFFRESDVATLALQGRHVPDGALPFHLRADNYDRTRAHLGRVRSVVGTLAALLESGTGRFDAFSLSDFGSYCGPADYGQSWKGIAAVAQPDARFCERIFMNPIPPPLERIVVDEDLSARLSRADKSIVYRIRAGTVGPC